MLQFICGVCLFLSELKWVAICQTFMLRPQKQYFHDLFFYSKISGYLYYFLKFHLVTTPNVLWLSTWHFYPNLKSKQIVVYHLKRTSLSNSDRVSFFYAQFFSGILLSFSICITTIYLYIEHQQNFIVFCYMYVAFFQTMKLT